MDGILMCVVANTNQHTCPKFFAQYVAHLEYRCICANLPLCICLPGSVNKQAFTSNAAFIHHALDVVPQSRPSVWPVSYIYDQWLKVKPVFRKAQDNLQTLFAFGMGERGCGEIYTNAVVNKVIPFHVIHGLFDRIPAIYNRLLSKLFS